MTDASCLCGATRISVDGPLKFSIRCFCRDCQKATGGGHAVQVGVDKERVTITGPHKVHEGVSDTGNALGFGFCGDCGSPLTKTTEMAPALTFLYAGALEDPASIPDIRNVFESGHQPWDACLLAEGGD